MRDSCTSKCLLGVRRYFGTHKAVTTHSKSSPLSSSLVNSMFGPSSADDNTLSLLWGVRARGPPCPEFTRHRLGVLLCQEYARC